MAKDFDKITPLEQIRHLLGGDAAIARKMKFKGHQNVQYWFKLGYIPSCYATKVMRLTKGKIKAVDIVLAAAKARGEL